jgi:prepilin-type N-terminal cleavage/methylation domain-containing protein/prepilin-type processing-associated H-X9-DG protein
MKTRTKAGFTLIELLVVIGIIAILAAILFPVFARVKESAKTSVCSTQMRQVGLSVSMYSGDNNDGLPRTWTWQDKDKNHWCGTDDTWKQITRPYQKCDDLYKCPSFSGNRLDCTTYVANPSVRWLGEYGINNWAYIDQFAAVNPTSDYESHEYSKISGIDLPSETLFIGENGDGDWIVEPEAYRCIDPNLGQGIYTEDPGIIKFRHGGLTMATAAFVDGHMKALRREQFLANNCYIWWRHKPLQ